MIIVRSPELCVPQPTLQNHYALSIPMNSGPAIEKKALHFLSQLLGRRSANDVFTLELLHSHQ